MCKQSVWFMFFMQRLLEGSREVKPLLAEDPFPDEPPLFLRATKRRFRLASIDERRDKGRAWIVDKRVIEFCKPQRIKAGLIVDAPDYQTD